MVAPPGDAEGTNHPREYKIGYGLLFRTIYKTEICAPSLKNLPCHRKSWIRPCLSISIIWITIFAFQSAENSPRTFQETSNFKNVKFQKNSGDAPLDPPAGAYSAPRPPAVLRRHSFKNTYNYFRR